MKHDFILSDNVYLDQRDNLNPDGTSNMVWSKTWARFNQCFISSATATYNQVCQRLIKKNNLKITHTPIDELSYLKGILKSLNGGKDATSDNDKRFHWDVQTRYLNNITPAAISELGTWVYCDFEEAAYKKSIRSGLQCILNIWIKDYYPSGNGHVVSGVGWCDTDTDDKMDGIFINDPAGNILAKKSYYSNESGKEIFLEKSMFKKIFINKRQMIFFEEV